MINTRPLSVEDFSGGIVDKYMDRSLNKYKEADNLLITKHKKLFMRPGTLIDDVFVDQIPSGTSRIGALINYDDEYLFAQSGRNLYYSNTDTLLGPGTPSNPVLGAGDTSNFVSFGYWRRHLFLTNDTLSASVVKVYKDNAGILQVRKAGLRVFSSAPTATPSPTGSAFHYLYRFLFSYTYTVDDVTFKDFGPTLQMAVQMGGAIGGANKVDFTSLDEVTHGTSDNYDTANIKIEIYRTVNDGTVFYKVAEINNAIPTYSDSSTDATIQTNELLYTEGGILENYPPPICKYIHIVNNLAYYGHCKVGAETFRNRVYQSKKSDLDSVPQTNYVDIEDEVIGLGSYKSYPLIFGKKYTHRIDGEIDILGRGLIITQRIADNAGCVSHLSIVQTPVGTFWAGTDGFYWTNGYQVIKVSGELDETYSNITSTVTKQKRIVGMYDKKEYRVWWTAQYDTTSHTDNDKIFVLDLRAQVARDMPFVTLSGGDNFYPSSLCYFSNTIKRADTRGYVFKFDEDTHTDPKIDTAIAAPNWDKETILYSYISCGTAFGSKFVRKFVPRILVTQENITNNSVKLVSINDDGRLSSSMKEIRNRTNFVWGDPNFVWGDPEFKWNVSGIIERQRRFPAGSLRCSYKQVQMTNAYSIISASDVYGTATVTVAKTATLDNSALADWPINAKGYFLSFENDNYVKQYEVTIRTPDTLTFSDSGGSAPTGSVKWLLKGFRKGEAFGLLSFVYHFAPLTKSQKIFQGETGGNT